MDAKLPHQAEIDMAKTTCGLVKESLLSGTSYAQCILIATGGSTLSPRKRLNIVSTYPLYLMTGSTENAREQIAPPCASRVVAPVKVRCISIGNGAGGNSR
jgi:hypothetical protein